MRVVYPISHTRARAHVCTSAVPPHPHTMQDRKHHSEVSADTATLKGKGALQKRRLTFDVTEGQFVEAQRSMRVPSFNTLHMWRDLLLTEKVLKSALKVCGRCEMPHSLFYWPLLRTCENPNG